MNKLLSNLLELIKNSIDFVIDIFYFHKESTICLLIILLFIGSFYYNPTNKITNNYILYSNLTAKINCPEGKLKCIVTTEIGNFKVSHIISEKIDNKKFDMGMYFGTCENTLYLKVYQDDIITPYTIIEVDDYEKSSSEYSFYNAKYKINTSKCE